MSYRDGVVAGGSKKTLRSEKVHRPAGGKPADDNLVAVSANEAVSQAFEAISRLAERKGRMHPRAVSAGFKDVDGALRGILPGELALLCGASGAGKTAIALNIAVNAAKMGARVLFFSQAASALETTMHILTSEARVSLGKLRGGYISEDDWSAIADASNRVAALDLSICDAPLLTMRGARKVAEELFAGSDKALVVFDDLDWVSPANGDPRDSALAARQLKLLARELDVGALATVSPAPGASPARALGDALGADKALAGLGGAESAADVVLVLDRAAAVGEAGERGRPPLNCADLYIAKSRCGPAERVRLAFVPEYLRFMDFADDGLL